MKTKKLMRWTGVLSLVALATISFAQQSKRSLTNSEVIRMVKDGVREPSILEAIRSRPGAFDLSNAARSALFQAGGKNRAGEMTKIWDAMIAKATNGRGGDSADDLNPQPSPKGTLLAPGGQRTLLGSQAATVSGGGGKKADDLNPQSYSPKGKAIDPELQTKLGPPKAGPVVKNPRAGQINAAIIAVLKKQRGAADVEAAQMKLGLRPATQVGAVGGPSQTMSATGNGGTTGQVAGATGSSSMASLLPPPTGIGGPSGHTQGGTLAAAQLHYFNSTALTCAHDPTFRILTVSGSGSPATFTPIDQYNLYTISGCSFGNTSGTAYIYGTGSFRLNFIVKFWSDPSIVVSLDPAITGIPDLNNLTLVVQRKDLQQAEKGGFNFYAARDKVMLATIPTSWVNVVTMTSSFVAGSKTLTPNYVSPSSVASHTPPGTAYVGRFYNGVKFDPTGQSDLYDFSQLSPGWTTDSFQLTTYAQNCPLVVTYRQNFGTWYGNWDQKNPNNIRVWLSDTTCSGVMPPTPWINYQNWTGSYYALNVWVNGPRGIDPLTGQPGQ